MVYNDADFCRKTGLKASFVSEMKSGKKPFTEQTLQKIEHSFPQFFNIGNTEDSPPPRSDVDRFLSIIEADHQLIREMVAKKDEEIDRLLAMAFHRSGSCWVPGRCSPSKTRKAVILISARKVKKAASFRVSPCVGRCVVYGFRIPSIQSSMRSDWLQPRSAAHCLMKAAVSGWRRKLTALRFSFPLVGLPLGLLVCPFGMAAILEVIRLRECYGVHPAVR